MTNFLEWAIERAQVTQETVCEYEGKKYLETIKIFHGNMNPGRVRKLAKEFGNCPVNEEFKNVTCKWGGNYKNDAGKVRVSQATYHEIH